MGFIDGDIVPSASGRSHLGIEARGATNFDIGSLSPFGHVHQLSGVLHNEIGTSGVLRFGSSTMQKSNDGGKTFSDIGITQIPGNEGDVLIVSNGAVSSSPSLNFKPSIDTLGISGLISMTNRSLDATSFEIPQPSGTIKIEAINLAERGMIGLTGSGQKGTKPYFMQPALFNKFVFMIKPSTSNAVSSYGDPVTSNGVISHPTPTPESGCMVNQVTSTTANRTCTVGSTALLFCRGSESGVNTGFFYAARITLPDASYSNLIVFCGLTSITMVNALASINPAATQCGFQFEAGGAGTTWQFFSKDGSTPFYGDTGIAFSSNAIYDMYIYMPPFPNNDIIYWTLHDLSRNKIANGYAKDGLPFKNSMMRAGIGINNVTAVARNLRYQHVYCESLG